jgi:hypothetical protein
MLYSIFSRGCDLHMEKCDNFSFREFISASLRVRYTHGWDSSSSCSWKNQQQKLQTSLHQHRTWAAATFKISSLTALDRCTPAPHQLDRQSSSSGGASSPQPYVRSPATLPLLLSTLPKFDFVWGVHIFWVLKEKTWGRQYSVVSKLSLLIF